MPGFPNHLIQSARILGIVSPGVLELPAPILMPSRLVTPAALADLEIFLFAISREVHHQGLKDLTPAATPWHSQEKTDSLLKTRGRAMTQMEETANSMDHNEYFDLENSTLRDA